MSGFLALKKKKKEERKAKARFLKERSVDIGHVLERLSAEVLDGTKVHNKAAGSWEVSLSKNYILYVGYKIHPAYHTEGLELAVYEHARGEESGHIMALKWNKEESKLEDDISELIARFIE